MTPRHGPRNNVLRVGLGDKGTHDSTWALVIRYRGDDEPHRVRGVSTEDLLVLSEFLQGKKKHTVVDDQRGTEEEHAMKEYVGRLSELLDVEVVVPPDSEDGDNGN